MQDRHGHATRGPDGGPLVETRPAQPKARCGAIVAVAGIRGGRRYVHELGRATLHRCQRSGIHPAAVGTCARRRPGLVVLPGARRLAAAAQFRLSRWEPDPAVFWQWLFLLGAFVLAAALWAVRNRTRAPLATFLLFAGSLFPVLGVVYFYSMRYSWVWDHWQYLPDLAPIAFIAACLALGWESVALRWRPLGPALASLLILTLGVLTWQHTAMFHDNDTLYRMTLERNPDCWMAHNNLGADLAKSPGHVADALAHYEAALRIRPDYAEAHNNLGILLAKLPDRRAEALSQYEQALHFQPDFSEAHDNLANLLATIPAAKSKRSPITRRPCASNRITRTRISIWPGCWRSCRVAKRKPSPITRRPCASSRTMCRPITTLPCSSPARAHRGGAKTWTRALQIDPGYDDARRNLQLLQQQAGR